MPLNRGIFLYSSKVLFSYFDMSKRRGSEVRGRRSGKGRKQRQKQGSGMWGW